MHTGKFQVRVEGNVFLFSVALSASLTFFSQQKIITYFYVFCNFTPTYLLLSSKKKNNYVIYRREKLR